MLGQLQRKYLGATIPVINIHGVIKQQMTQNVTKRLSKINVSRAVALAVSVNSPGGLPVQSQIISNKILNFAKKNNLKLYTFGRDVAASGGYFVLSIGDQVVCDRNTILGSIGVVMSKMHWQGILQKTSLQYKILSSNQKMLGSVLSPFNDLNEQQRSFLKQRLVGTHEKFISHVKKYRGSKLINSPQIFSGEIFTGQQALQKGLVDQVGSMVKILQQKYPDAKLQVSEEEKSLPLKLFGV